MPIWIKIKAKLKKTKWMWANGKQFARNNRLRKDSKRWMPKKTTKRNKATQKKKNEILINVIMRALKNFQLCSLSSETEIPRQIRNVKRERAWDCCWETFSSTANSHRKWTTSQNFQMKIKWIETMNRHTLYGGVGRVRLSSRNNIIMLDKQLRQSNKKICSYNTNETLLCFSYYLECVVTATKHTPTENWLQQSVQHKLCTYYRDLCSCPENNFEKVRTK